MTESRDCIVLWIRNQFTFCNEYLFRLSEGILFCFQILFREIWRMFVCILFYMYINFTKINELFFSWLKIEYDYYWGKKWKVMEYLSGFFLHHSSYRELNSFWMGFAVLFFVLSGAVGHYTCRYNGLVFVKSKSLERKKWLRLRLLFFLVQRMNILKEKYCQMNFNVERKDVNEMTIKGYCYSFRKHSR